MKFSEMPYTRPDMKQWETTVNEMVERFRNAGSAQEQEEIYRAYDKASDDFRTNMTVAHVRHSSDTRDEFYSKEIDFADEISPACAELSLRMSNALLDSKFRPELEQRLGKLLFTNLEIARRSFDVKNMALMQEENKLSSQYQKLYASAVVEFDGKKLPLPQLGPYKESPDRAVRRSAYETEGKWFDSHQEELDELYDKLVKNRTAQGKIFGYDTYIPLAYDLLGRNCYGPKDVAAFRDQIAADMVPIVARVKENQKKRLGVGKLMFYDDVTLFPDGNAVPQGSADDILAAGRQMYQELSPEAAEFGQALFDGELLDVLSKEGKAPGGYCTDLPSYGVPFIFSNFNGTAGDVDVLTHEGGHAFAFYRAMKNGCLSELRNPTMESCECHSMSMEFLTAPWHGKFFGNMTRKYEIGHCESSLIFIPYGCMVDEFQHLMYENPNFTPAQRNETWLELEKKYRPWIDFDNLPFYGRGAGWQRQHHIYRRPFYYIDYCMAQTVALQFWTASLRDYKDAWSRYLTFVDAAGTKTFEQLVHDAGLKLPYDPGCIKAVGGEISQWLDRNPL